MNYYFMDYDYVKGGAVGLELVNEALLGEATGRPVLGPLFGERGFPAYPELPHFQRRPGRAPRDLEQWSEFWLISARMKVVLEEIAARDCAFTPCRITQTDGAPGPEYYLCDVLTVLDAIDEARSQVVLKHQKSGRKTYQMTPDIELAFRPEVVEGHHLFRPEYLRPQIVCDDMLKQACGSAGLKGLKFRAMGAALR